MIRNISRAFCLLFIIFTGCASSGSGSGSAPARIEYDWGTRANRYETLLENYLDGKEPIEAQIAKMSQEIRRIESSGKVVPPGSYAHLGMLYQEAGNREEALNCYEKEKMLFPDSIPFMDFVINNRRRFSGVSEGPVRSIVILPPVNHTENMNAAKNFRVWPTVFLANDGYYVIPASLSTQVFIQNGMSVAQEVHNLPHSRLRQIFGADAALYIDVVYCGLMLNTGVVEARCRLVDLRTGEVLREAKGSGSEEIRVGRRRGLLSNLAAVTLGDAAGNIVGVVEQARDMDYNGLSIEACGSMMRSLIRNMPYGPYHPRYTPAE